MFKRVTKAKEYLRTFCHLLQLLLNIFCFSLNSSGTLSFITTTFDQFQFYSQKGLPYFNVLVLTRLEIRLHAFFIKWGWKIKLLFVGRQEFGNYRDDPFNISRNCRKSLRSDNCLSWSTRIFGKAVSTQPAESSVVFAWVILFFLLSIASWFYYVCFLIFFALVLKFLAQQLIVNQHRQFLQFRQHFWQKMLLQLPQNFC